MSYEGLHPLIRGRRYHRLSENMTDVLLRVENLHVSVGDTPIIHGINLDIKRGEIHAIMGRNGSGKSTLANVIMGHPAYEITSGSIFYKGENINEMEVFERARAGMFLSFQYPAAIPGVQVGNFLHLISMHFASLRRGLMPLRKKLDVSSSPTISDYWT